MIGLFRDNSILKYCFHFVVAICLYVVLYLIISFLEINWTLPNNDNLLQWDSWWYKSIVDEGYIFSKGIQCNSGFAPLFPYTWRLFQLSNAGISIFNLLVFGVTFVFLSNCLKLELKKFYLFLSFPSALFFYVPYTESLFFLFVSIAIIGQLKKNQILIVIGLFLTSMVRTSAIFSIPAIIVVGIFSFLETRNIIKSFKFILPGAIASLLGILCVALIQYQETGVWFAFAKAQMDGWKHHFQLPGFPLTTWDNARVLWLDGLAFLLGMFSLVGLLGLFIKNIKHQLSIDASLIYSLSFLTLTLIYGIFFQAKDETTGQTGIISLNRYMFACPFFVVVISKMPDYFSFTETKNKLVIGAIIIGTWMLLGFGSISLTWLERFNMPHMKTVMYFLILTLYVISLLYIVFSRRDKVQLILLIIPINMILQLHCFHYFLNSIWVG